MIYHLIIQNSFASFRYGRKDAHGSIVILRLSVFSYTGLTSAHFIIPGKDPKLIDVFIMWQSVAEGSLWAIRMSFPGMRSYPVALLGLRFFQNNHDNVSVHGMKIEIFYHIIVMTLYHHDARMICLLIDSLGHRTSSLWPISDAVEMKKSSKISETSAASVLVSPFSFKIILPPFLNFLSDMKGDIVLQNSFSCFLQFFQSIFAWMIFFY